MNLRQILVVVGAAGMLAAGCGNADYKKTKDGLAYKIISDGKGKKIEPGQFLKLNFSTVVGDSVIYSTFEHVPAYGRYDSSATTNYDFIDFLGEMRVGDSAVFTRSIDTLEKRGMLQFNDLFKKGGTIKGHVKVLNVFDNEVAMNEDHAKELEMEKEEEIAKLQAYLKEKNVTNAQRTPGGVFVVMEKEGTGAQVDSGKRVSVNYTGYLKNGQKFDSNVDSSFQHPQPYDFVVGTGQVIPGWDEALKLFKEGGEGKIYVPAMMAYGPQSQGERMPPFSDLVFDIKVLSVGQPAAPIPGMQENAMPGQ